MLICCPFQTKEILSKHLMLYLRKDSKVKANNVAKEYVNCQVGTVKSVVATISLLSDFLA